MTIKIRRIDFYPTDWLEGSIGLTHEERSVYITVCACIYARGGPVELPHVRKFCPGHGFKRGFEGLLRKGKITQNGLNVDQKRTAIELIKARARTERGLSNIRNTRKSISYENPHLPPTNTTQQLTPKKETRARVYDPRFVRWFQGYPEKVGKGAAEVAFLKALKKGATEEELTAGVLRYIAHKPADRPWCNPATWLNQERWNDEYTTNGSGALSEPRGPRSPPPTLQDLGLEE